MVDPPPAFLQPIEEEEDDDENGEDFCEGDSEILPFVEDAQGPVDYDEVLDTVVPKKMLRQVMKSKEYRVNVFTFKQVQCIFGFKYFIVLVISSGKYRILQFTLKPYFKESSWKVLNSLDP